LRPNIKRAAITLAALLCASTSGAAIAAESVIILTDNMSDNQTAATGLRDRLLVAGYDVTMTVTPSDLTGALSNYMQVWDVRITTAFEPTLSTSYLDYLNGAGGLFLLGEHSGFATRNNSLLSFIDAAGGGDVQYGGGSVVSQFVTEIFNGAGTVAPDSATSFYVPAAGTFATAGNGVFITTSGAGGTGAGTGIAFGAGSLQNAPAGRLLTYLDVNTFQANFYNATPALRALIDRMIGFVAGTVTVTPTPAVPSIIDGSQPSFDLSDPAAAGATITFDGGMLDMTGGSDPHNIVTADVRIENGGAFINTGGGNSMLTGTVSGTGGLIVSGQGTLALGGTNTYAGGTVISDFSTVQIDSSEALGTGGVVLMNGRLATAASMIIDAPVVLMSGVNVIDTGWNEAVLTGSVSGAGGFLKAGNSRLVLSGPNSHTGGTVVQAGTLAGDTNSLFGDIANAGVVEFTQGTDGTYAGTLSGAGALVKTGNGRLVLSGANSYTGGTVVHAGTLAGDTSSLVGDIANAGVVEFAQGTDGTYAGTLSGSGALVKTGNGRLVLSGANSFTGGTVVQAGTLAGDTSSLAGDIANAGVVEFAQGINGAYAGTLSGAGGLVKTGNGYLVLSGANSYTGGTVVQAGTLAGDTRSLVGDIANAGVVEFAQGIDGTYAGTLSGTGALAKYGNGRLVLSGANSYTGGTVVHGGTLAGDTGSLTGDIANLAVVEFAQDANGTYAGTLFGNGGLVKAGNGRLLLSGANTYTGGTVVQAGTLAGDSSSLTGDIANLGVVEFAQGADGTYAGTLSGTGGLVKTGNGRLLLSGANTYTGETVVQAGTLAGDTSSLVGDIANAGVVEFAQGIDGTYAGTLSGAGALVKTGTGRLVLSGAHSHAGATIVQAGTLAGDTNSLGGDIVNTGIVEFAQEADGTFAGSLLGTGGIMKTGGGRLNLTAVSSYNGATFVEQGLLAVNGSIAQSVVVVDAGAIGGNGLVGRLIVRNGASAAPGNSIGQLQAATSVLFQPGSAFEVEVDASGASDRVVATGVAYLEGGTVRVLAANGDYRPQTRYSILQAAQVDGEFAEVTSNLAFLMPTLSYTPTAVSLTLTRNDVRFTDVALTANQRATASAVERGFAPSSDLYYALVDQDAQSARTMFDQLSGEVHASTLNVAVQNAGGLRHALLQRAGLAGAPSTNVWAELTGAWSNIAGDGNAVDVSADSRGLRGGIEAAIGAARFGIAAGHDDGDLRLVGRASSAALTSTHAGVYAAGTLGRLGVRAGATNSWVDVETTRDTASALSQQLTASYDGRIIQGFAEAGYSVPVGPVILEPFAGVDALWLKSNGFREQGGSLALTSVGQTQSYAWSTLGAKGRFAIGNGSPVSANFKAGWQHALSERNVESEVSFANGGPIFSIEGAPLAKNAGLLDVGLSWEASQAVRLGVSYVGTLSDQGDTHAAKAALSVSF
jgi:autotransporter-associated beta strand protein